MTQAHEKIEARLRHVFEEIVPFNRVLGIKVESTDPAAPKLRFDMRPDLIGNPRRQMLHGGVISAVLDVTAGIAIHLAVAQQKIRFHARGSVPEHRHHQPARRLSAAGARQLFHRHRPRGAARQSCGGRADGVGERLQAN